MKYLKNHFNGEIVVVLLSSLYFALICNISNSDLNEIYLKSFSISFITVFYFIRIQFNLYRKQKKTTFINNNISSQNELNSHIAGHSYNNSPDYLVREFKKIKNIQVKKITTISYLLSKIIFLIIYLYTSYIFLDSNIVNLRGTIITLSFIGILRKCFYFDRFVGLIFISLAPFLCYLALSPSLLKIANLMVIISFIILANLTSIYRNNNNFKIIPGDFLKKITPYLLSFILPLISCDYFIKKDHSFLSKVIKKVVNRTYQLKESRKNLQKKKLLEKLTNLKSLDQKELDEYIDQINSSDFSQQEIDNVLKHLDSLTRNLPQQDLIKNSYSLSKNKGHETHQQNNGKLNEIRNFAKKLKKTDLDKSEMIKIIKGLESISENLQQEKSSGLQISDVNSNNVPTSTQENINLNKLNQHIDELKHSDLKQSELNNIIQGLDSLGKKGQHKLSNPPNLNSKKDLYPITQKSDKKINENIMNKIGKEKSFKHKKENILDLTKLRQIRKNAKNPKKIESNKKNAKREYESFLQKIIISSILFGALLLFSNIFRKRSKVKLRDKFSNDELRIIRNILRPKHFTSLREEIYLKYKDFYSYSNIILGNENFIPTPKILMDTIAIKNVRLGENASNLTNLFLKVQYSSATNITKAELKNFRLSYRKFIKTVKKTY